MIETIIELIQRGSTILTPNRRLAATLHQIYNDYQKESERYAWQTADILPLSSWLQRLWTDYTASHLDHHPLLLTNSQEQFLWEKILTEAEESPLLLQISQTADLARSAWSLLKQWRVTVAHPIFETADDYLALKRWITCFEMQCRKMHWLDSASLADELEKKISESKIEPPKELVLIGFNEISPQLTAFLNRCKERGSYIHHTTLACDESVCQQLPLPDRETELYTLARWAKAQHAKYPTAKIGCVIPTLDKIRGRVSQIFAEVFAPEHMYTIDAQNSPFNISAGRPLQVFPVTNVALQLLSLYKKTTSSDTLSCILATPFVGEAESERVKRAHFDAILRRENINTINLRESILASEPNKRSQISQTCPQLAKRLKAYFDLLDKQPEKKTFSAWAHTFNELLTALGWPGERSISSDEYQTVHAWLDLLGQMQLLDQVSEPISYHTALQTLKKMASTTTFQPKTPQTPIQVLGLLEAAGLPFDFLWVTGLDDMSWPPQPKPNPFIPKRLQRELQMPHATAERELIYCEQITKQLKQCAPVSIFSYAEKLDDIELNASPLIKDLPISSDDSLLLDEWQRAHIKVFSARDTITLIDTKAPSCEQDEKVSGGVDVIKQQALCPFKAFAKLRLHARQLESPLPGLRPQDRGTIIHSVLERVWNRLRDHATLVSTSDSDLRDLLTKCIEEALKTHHHSRSHFTQYMSLEKIRLERLIWDWLQIEKARDPFRVDMSEKSAEIKIGQLTLSVRIDRIDEVMPNKKLIIDYKTGKNNDINDWFSERPEEPQLPLYTLLAAQDTVGVAFAQVTTGKPCFKGVSSQALDIEGIKSVDSVKNAEDNWEKQITQWRTVLQQLSDNFYQGVATVDPKHPVETCNYCELQALCRIYEESAPENTSC